MKKNLNYFLGAILTLGIASVFYFAEIKKANAQDVSKSSIVVVREYFVTSAFEPSKIVIAYGDNKTESIDLEIMSPKHWEVNTDKIEYVLNKLINSGYTLVTSNGSGGGQVAFMINTYVLKKI